MTSWRRVSRWSKWRRCVQSSCVYCSTYLGLNRSTSNRSSATVPCTRKQLSRSNNRSGRTINRCLVMKSHQSSQNILRKKKPCCIILIALARIFSLPHRRHGVRLKSCRTWHRWLAKMYDCMIWCCSFCEHYFCDPEICIIAHCELSCWWPCMIWKSMISVL